MVLLWSWNLLLWLPVFILSGASLKLLDEASDRLKRQKDSRAPLLFLGFLGAFSTALLFLWVSSISPFFAALYTGIILGVFIVGKVDSPFFVLGTIVYFMGLFFLRLNWPIIALWNVLLFVIFSAIDELGHTLLENRPNSRLNTPLVVFFFKYRFLLKVGVLVLFFSGLLDGVAAIGLWLFDIGYVLTDHMLINR